MAAPCEPRHWACCSVGIEPLSNGQPWSRVASPTSTPAAAQGRSPSPPRPRSRWRAAWRAAVFWRRSPTAWRPPTPPLRRRSAGSLGGSNSLRPRPRAGCTPKASIPSSPTNGGGSPPVVIPSLVWSLYAFLHAPDDYWTAVCTAIAAGGDTDTMAAITGAIAGARLGEASAAGPTSPTADRPRRLGRRCAARSGPRRRPSGRRLTDRYTWRVVRDAPRRGRNPCPTERSTRMSPRRWATRRSSA